MSSDLENPQVSGDTISGYGPTGVVGIPLADVAEASVQKVEVAQPAIVILFTAAIVGIFVTMLTFSF